MLLAAAAALAVAAAERKGNPAFDFIAGNRPVSEDQVRQKLVSDGWMDVHIALRGADTLLQKRQRTAGLKSFPSIH